MAVETSILIVDDDPLTLSFIARVLQEDGYQVYTARDGAQALRVLEVQAVDLIVSDIMMPRMNGYQLHGRLMENPEWVLIPVVFLSARNLDSDIRYAKEMGVDDYLTKPVEPEDLLAAVRGRLLRAQMQRSVRGTPGPASAKSNGDWSIGRLRINKEQYRVWLDGTPIRLSLTEFKLLSCLARRSHQVVPLQELIKSTHGLDASYTEASALLRPLVRSIRRKLGYPAGDMGCIQSVRGIGYQLEPPRYG
jgi:DNA-binding response OmpR family regulator